MPILLLLLVPAIIAHCLFARSLLATAHWLVMTIEIFIDYRMHGSSEWETVEFTPEEYYDHSYYEEEDDPIEWDSVPEWDKAIEY